MKNVVIFCCCVLCLLALGPAFGRDAVGVTDDLPGGYPPKFHNADFNVIIAKIRSIRRGPDPKVTFDAEALGDMRGGVKIPSDIQIEGFQPHLIDEGGASIPSFSVGSVVVVPAMPGPAAGNWQYSGSAMLPIGVDSGAAISEADVQYVRAGLKELNEALGAPGGVGPSTKRVDELLKEKNYYTWAVGVWRLGKNADAADLEKLEGLLIKPGLSPSQALWVDSVIESLTGSAAVLDRHGLDSRYGLLRRFLEHYVKEQAVSGAPGSGPSK